MVFPPLGNSDHVVVTVSIDFPSNSQWDAPFHHIAYDYSCNGWKSLHDHFRDVPWEDIIKPWQAVGVQLPPKIVPTPPALQLNMKEPLSSPLYKPKFSGSFLLQFFFSFLQVPPC